MPKLLNKGAAGTGLPGRPAFRAGAALGAGSMGAGALGAGSAGAIAIGAFALGAFAMGAVAIGALTIGRLSIGKLWLRDARIDRLSVGSLEIDGQLVDAHPSPPLAYADFLRAVIRAQK